MKEKKQRRKKKFTAIAKVGYDPAIKKNICVLYRFDNFDKFLIFMQKKYSPIWINIFFNTGDQKGKLYKTWGKIKGLQTAY